MTGNCFPHLVVTKLALDPLTVTELDSAILDRQPSSDLLQMVQGDIRPIKLLPSLNSLPLTDLTTCSVFHHSLFLNLILPNTFSGRRWHHPCTGGPSEGLPTSGQNQGELWGHGEESRGGTEEEGRGGETETVRWEQTLLQGVQAALGCWTGRNKDK